MYTDVGSMHTGGSIKKIGSLVFTETGKKKGRRKENEKNNLGLNCP